MTNAEKYLDQTGWSIGETHSQMLEACDFAEAYARHVLQSQWKDYPENKPEERGWYLCRVKNLKYDDIGHVVLPYEKTFEKFNHLTFDDIEVVQFMPIPK